MPENKPRGRQKNVTGGHSSVNKRGEGLGTGSVGNAGGYSGRPGTGSGMQSGNRDGGVPSGARASLPLPKLGGKSGIILIIIVVIAFFLLKDKLPIFDPGAGSSDFLSNFTSSSVSTGWTRTANTGKLNTSVAPGAREKYVKVKGNGKDTVTLMVYMCGTDLESKSGMASSDLAEMCKATLSDKLNILVYTGGCSRWQTDGISSSKTQIWKIENGGIRCLKEDMGNVAMTSPSTLSKFIQWCKTNYPADRSCLIFWDHGGGSLSGYGYDEKFTKSGSMTLAGINTALRDGGVKFDFIGFDACLMATAENALVLSQYADYLIASEETEPGVGWYYTNWLTKLASNTSLSTLEVGKNICDDFTDYCAKYVKGAQTTLSVIDLAELESAMPDDLKSFATSTTELINSDSYKEISDARSGSREFSPSSKIDQVDLVDLATRMDTKEGKALAETILSAVKYNRASSSMTNSYGLSIYFPYRRVSTVDSAVREYDAIGLDDEYAECIKSFAGLETAGQVAAGGTSSALPSLLGTLSSFTGGSSSSAISSLLNGFIGGSSDIDISGLASTGLSFLSGLNVGKASDFVAANRLDASDFIFKKSDGQNVISLPDEKWALVHDIELNVFVDDGEGFIDLGLDNVFSYTERGELLAEYDGTWLALNGQAVAYYHVSTFDDGTNYTIKGRVPVLYNGERADLTVIFDNANPKGYVSGVTFAYAGGETDTVAKTSDLAVGAEIEFLCDYYTYAGEYQDSYRIGDKITYDGTLTVSDVYVDGTLSATYRITDIYGQHFWTSVMG